MTGSALPEDVREFLARANPAVMATVRRDGAPVSVATWYLLDGEQILLTLDATRVRLAHLRREPRVALTVLADGDWYSHLSLQLRVTRIWDDVDLVGTDRISTHYSGRRYPNRTSPRVMVALDVDHRHGWGHAPKD